MSILIKGMEMPKNGHTTITISDDGEVVCNSEVIGGKYQYRSYGPLGKAVPVPPHGRLIESKAFLKVAHETDDFSLDELAHLAVLVAATPTVIPAEPPKEE